MKPQLKNGIKLLALRLRAQGERMLYCVMMKKDESNAVRTELSVEV